MPRRVQPGQAAGAAAAQQGSAQVSVGVEVAVGAAGVQVAQQAADLGPAVGVGPDGDSAVTVLQCGPQD